MNENDMISNINRLLKDVFLSVTSVVYLIKDSKIVISKNIEYPLDSGIIGEAANQRKIVETSDNHRHPVANFNLDIDTVLPTVSVPVVTQDN